MTLSEIILKSGVSSEVLAAINKDYVTTEKHESMQDMIEDYLIGALAYAEITSQKLKKKITEANNAIFKKKAYKEELEKQKKDKIAIIRRKYRITEKGESTEGTEKVLQDEIELLADNVVKEWCNKVKGE